MDECNFFKSSLESDRDLFLKKKKNETFVEIQDNWTMANIVVTLGIFPSVTQARANGWNKPIPRGFNDMRIGKNKRRAIIFWEK